MSWLAELRRRNVLRMAVLYVIAAWLIMQFAEVVITLAALPTWTGQTTLILLTIGFPIALIFSWFYEITPAGLTLEKDVPLGESITFITGRRIDFIVIALLASALVMFAYDKWWIRSEATAVTTEPNSIAVLPFVNMSDDPVQEYFSEGLAEELLNQMTRIPSLKVISRTSSFSFKGENIDIVTIAERLNVRHILEGSVRISDGNARISATLVDARDDRTLWSQTFDRNLEDILSIQNEIAREVVDALHITLLGDMPSARKTDPRAYAFYLQAKFVGNQMTPDNLERSIELYRQALAIDPGYVPAWEGLAWRLTSQANSGLRPGEGYEPAREAARQALEIDPNFARAHGRLGWIALFHDGDLHAAARHYERGLALDPTDMVLLGGAATLLQNLGRLDDAIIVKRHVSDRDPVYPAGHANLGIASLYAGDLDDAASNFRSTLTLSPNYIGARCLLGMTMLFAGNAEAALPVVEQESFEPYRLICLGLVQHAIGNEAESASALQKLIEAHAEGWAYNIAYIFAYRGEVDAAFEWLDKAVEYRDGGLADIVVQPFFNNLHGDHRWSAFLARLGKSPDQIAAVGFSISLPGD